MNRFSDGFSDNSYEDLLNEYAGESLGSKASKSTDKKVDSPVTPKKSANSITYEEPVFNIDVSIVSEDALLKSIVIVFVGIALQMFFKLVTSVLYALQKSSINNFLSLCTSVITIICVNILPSGTNDENIILMRAANVYSASRRLHFAWLERMRRESTAHAAERRLVTEGEGFL